MYYSMIVWNCQKVNSYISDLGWCGWSCTHDRDDDKDYLPVSHVDEGEGGVESGHEDVGEGEVEQEVVGHTPHPPMGAYCP